MILEAAKTLTRKALPAPMFRRVKKLHRQVLFRASHGFSEEEALIGRYIASVPIVHRYCVDIAAQDGVSGSQTLALFKRGWRGLAVEYDPGAFAILADLYSVFEGVALIRAKVTPDRVRDVLRAVDCPREFGFLSLDIDSYDYFVLEQILTEFRPVIMCVEINEAIPPPLRFTVCFDPGHFWRGDRFQGQSIAQCDVLCRRFEYDIVELHYNNLILVAKEHNRHLPLSIEEAYDSGYRRKEDRLARFPWNADVDELLTMSREEALAYLHELFADYKGKYILE